jgi:hypothetical protein
MATPERTVEVIPPSEEWPSAWQQITSDDVWLGPSALSFVDKAIGVEVIVRRFTGEGDDSHVIIPPEHVPSLIRALVGWSTTGSISIAAGVEP